MKVRLSLVALVALGSASCATIPESVEEKHGVCPLIEAKNWHAWIEPKSADTDSYVLNVSGEVVLPTPAYEVRLVGGIMDRKIPPSQRFGLQVKETGAMAAQVISTLPVRYRDKTPYPKWASIIIACNGQAIVTVPDVVIME